MNYLIFTIFKNQIVFIIIVKESTETIFARKEVCEWMFRQNNLRFGWKHW